MAHVKESDVFSSFSAQRGSLLLLHGLPPLRTHWWWEAKARRGVLSWLTKSSPSIPRPFSAASWKPTVSHLVARGEDGPVISPTAKGVELRHTFWGTFPCNWKLARKTARIWGAACDKILTLVSLELLLLTLASMWSNGGLGSSQPSLKSRLEEGT